MVTASTSFYVPLSGLNLANLGKVYITAEKPAPTPDFISQGKLKNQDKPEKLEVTASKMPISRELREMTALFNRGIFIGKAASKAESSPLSKSDYTRDGLVNKDELMATRKMATAQITTLRNALQDSNLDTQSLDAYLGYSFKDAMIGKLMDLNKQAEQIQTVITNFDKLTAQYGNGQEIKAETLVKLATGAEITEADKLSASKDTAEVDFKPIRLPRAGEQYFTKQDLENLLPILKKADMDRDGIVTRNELKNFKNLLLQQKDEILKTNVDKLLMDAVTTQRIKAGQEKAIQKLDSQVKQIDTLFIKDSKNVDVFEKLLPQIGSGKGIDLEKVVNIVQPMI